jgi:hypothetical protein
MTLVLFFVVGVFLLLFLRYRRRILPSPLPPPLSRLFFLVSISNSQYLFVLDESSAHTGNRTE